MVINAEETKGDKFAKGNVPKCSLRITNLRILLTYSVSCLSTYHWFMIVCKMLGYSKFMKELLQ